MSDERATTGRLVQKWFGPVVPDSMLGQALSFVDEAASLRGQVETLQAAVEKRDRYIKTLETTNRDFTAHCDNIEAQRDRARDIAALWDAAGYVDEHLLADPLTRRLAAPPSEEGSHA